MAPSVVSTDLSTRVLALFAANETHYAVGYENDGKMRYEMVARPLTSQVVADHIAGLLTLGIYPWREDGTVKWFAVDFDGPKDSAIAESFARTREDATRQQVAFQRAGLQTYLERSRSRRGVHLWGFLRDPHPVAEIRKLVVGLLVPGLQTMDRGKVYPSDPERSEHGTLICLPYGGHWLPEGTAFISGTDSVPIPLEAFLELAQPNANEVVARILRKLKTTAPAPSKPAAVGEPGISPEGRPSSLLPDGILKIFGPQGCRFLHHTWRDRHETGERRVTEPEWYAALGQLTAFEFGRAAAHGLWGDGPHYHAAGMDEKYDHACQSPPVGCQFIHERFPQWACEGCPMKAPYHLAERTLVQLERSGVGALEQGEYREDLNRIRRRNEGKETPGITTGVPALDRYCRLRDSELTVIGGLPSMGKTALMIDMAVNLAVSEVDVYLFSAESSREVVHDRLLAHESLIDSRALRGERDVPLRPDEYDRLDHAAQVLKNLPIFENYATTRAEHMLYLIERDRLRRGASLNKRYVTLFDYLQYGLEREPGEQGMFDPINRRLDELKALRKVLARPVVFYSQLTRESEGRDDPAMNWFRGSGNIEQLVDQAWILTGKRIEGATAPRTVWVVKQKEGLVGVSVPMVLHQTVCRFEAPQVPAAPDPQPEGLFGGEEEGAWT